MQPYYDHAGITIYNGDCREIMPQLPKVDLVLTDPPYGLGHKLHDGGTWGTNPIYDDMLVWDLAPVEPELLMLAIEKGNRAIIWGGNYFPLPPSRAWLVWRKNEKMPTLADVELCWTNLDIPAKELCVRRNPDGRRSHPTQKPLRIMQWCIHFCPNAQTILDPFMGSGTTLVAAKQLGRKAIGIEICEKYCEIAAKRLSQEVLPLGGNVSILPSQSNSAHRQPLPGLFGVREGENCQEKCGREQC